MNHELTHVISFAIIKNQPHWLAEGIATYFEMADLESGKASVQIGIPREDRLAILRQYPPLPAATLFACEDSRCMDDRFYATSWALFSFLLNERHDQLGRYLGPGTSERAVGGSPGEGMGRGVSRPAARQAR